MIVFLLFLCLGLCAAWRGKVALRAYNRRMFPSMQDKRRTYLWPAILICVLGAAVAFAARHLTTP